MSETANWKPLGENTIRKLCLYNPMCWDSKIDLSNENCCVSISKYGGLIAIAQSEGQPGRAGKRPDIFVFNAAGKQISSFRWNSGVLKGIAWTHADELLCLQEDGQALLYNIFLEYKRSFTMGMECRENKVVEYEAFVSQHGTGLAVMNGLYRFLIVNNIDDPKVRILADVPGLRKTLPSSWCVLPGPRTARVLAANDNEIYLLDSGGECFQQKPSGEVGSVSSYTAMSVSMDGKHIALVTDNGYLWTGSSDFQKKYCEINTGDGSRPKQMMWCSDSVSPPAMYTGSPPLRNTIAVVLYRPPGILVVGPKKDWVKYSVDEDRPGGGGAAVLSVDIDGVHIVTPSKHEYLHHILPTVQGIFRVGSMEPGALLRNAAKEYDNQSEKADEYLRMLLEKGHLERAVHQCMEAASAEYQPRLQKMLLQAASFGKSFVSGMELTDLFVATCQNLRVLNAVRDFKTGIALSATQMHHLTVEYLIDRLVQRRLFHLAYQICKFLKMPKDTGSSRILSHWACYKVQQSGVADQKIASDIRNKLSSAVGVSYASIAEKAIDCGRKDLAIKLLEFEPRAAEQVRLLSKLGKHRLALDKAVSSGNTDLAYSAISSLRERSNLSEFLVAIRQDRVAYMLHLKHCKEENEQMLKDLYEQEDSYLELAHCHIRDSLGTFRVEERVVALHSAQDCFSKAKEDFSTKATEEYLQLLREQTQLEQETDSSYVEGSLHDTLHSLLMAKDVKKAEQLRKQFKVSDKRWWWLRISTLAQQRSFAELESFSKSKKSPIGYLPFVEVCIQHSAPEEVVKYLPKISQDKRVAAILKTGNVDRAAQLAIQTRSPVDMDLVLKKCGAEHRAVAEQVKTALNQLQRR